MFSHGLSTLEMIKHDPGKQPDFPGRSTVYVVNPSIVNGGSLGLIHVLVKQKIISLLTHVLNHGISSVNLEQMPWIL